MNKQRRAEIASAIQLLNRADELLKQAAELIDTAVSIGRGGGTMRGQLQVRQGVTSMRDVYSDGGTTAGSITWGPWNDVQSLGWLVGFVLPHDNMVYEFRYAPQEADNG